MPIRGPRHCVGISLGSAGRRDAANSRTRTDGDCSDWVAFARDKLAQWKTRVKRAAMASMLPVEAFPVSGFAVQPAEMLTCVDCGKECRGLRTHQFRMHGKRCESRLFAFSSVCRLCVTDFRTRLRLIVHFRKCPTCVAGMREYGMSTLGPEEMAAANMKRQGRTLFDAASEPGRSLMRASVQSCCGSVSALDRAMCCSACMNFRRDVCLC